MYFGAVLYAYTYDVNVYVCVPVCLSLDVCFFVCVYVCYCIYIPVCIYVHIVCLGVCVFNICVFGYFVCVYICLFLCMTECDSEYMDWGWMCAYMYLYVFVWFLVWMCVCVYKCVCVYLTVCLSLCLLLVRWLPVLNLATVQLSHFTSSLVFSNLSPDLCFCSVVTRVWIYKWALDSWLSHFYQMSFKVTSMCPLACFLGFSVWKIYFIS